MSSCTKVASLWLFIISSLEYGLSQIIPVILSGGSGTRLWPVSRKAHPKQFLQLASDKTMLQNTLLRVNHLDQPIIVCNQDHRFLVAEQAKALNITPKRILLEPVARNTAPAIALAALAAIEENPDCIIAVFPADHVIKDQSAFDEALLSAIDLAQKGNLVTFGIIADKPETGYGYIRAKSNQGPAKVDGFVEKPDLETAQKYLDSGDYFWNSGMFVFKAQQYIFELETFQPALLAACQQAFEQAASDLDFLRINQQAFAQAADISVDYAIMENTDKAWVVPLAADWSDVGAWSSLWEVMEKDEQGNSIQGDVLLDNCSGCLAQSEHKLIAGIGLDNIVIVETKDAILVAEKSQAQNVKNIVEKLKQQSRTEHLLHRKVYRPWGSYDGLESGEQFQVKRITVNPGASLSLQMHFHRAEHWIVVEGTADIEIDDNKTLLSPNQSIYIPLGAKHRLTNPGKIPLELIEVQSGSYLGEDDIVRFEDHYGRVE